MTERGKPPAAPEVVARHGRDLQAVNDKLRELVDALRTQRQRQGQHVIVDPPSPPAPAHGAPSPNLERKRLHEELRIAREALERRNGEEADLRERLRDIEQEHRTLCEHYVAVEELNSDLVALCAALKRLHGTLDRAEVLGAIDEIIVNLIGCEEFSLYELDPGGSVLRLARSLGRAGAGDAEAVPVGAGDLGRVAQTGVAFVAGKGEPCELPDLTAAVPLKVAGRVTGVLALYRLLGHKPLLRERDAELLELLESHAASALYVAGLRAAANER